MKIKPFKHEEIVGLADAANWCDYPKESLEGVDIHEDSNFTIREVF